MFVKKRVLPHQLTFNGISILSIIISCRGLMACFHGVTVLFCLSTMEKHEQHDPDKNRDGLQRIHVYHYQIQYSPHNSLYSSQLCNSRPVEIMRDLSGKISISCGSRRRSKERGHRFFRRRENFNCSVHFNYYNGEVVQYCKSICHDKLLLNYTIF